MSSGLLATMVNSQVDPRVLRDAFIINSCCFLWAQGSQIVKDALYRFD